MVEQRISGLSDQLMPPRTPERFARNAWACKHEPPPAGESRTIRVLLPPHQQMLDRLVVEAAVLRAPDGVQLRLMRRMAELPQSLEQDWQSAVA